MTRLLKKTLILAALAVVFRTITAAAKAGSAVVDADALRLRSEPSTSSEILTQLPNGAVVEVLEVLDGWYRISYSGMEGYVSAEYLVYTPETDAAPVEEVQEEDDEATISGSEVNFRAGPSERHAVITTLDLGEQVELLGMDSGWCEVVFNGQVGYVNAQYVSVDGLAVEDPRGIITGDCVNVRSAPTTNSDVLSKVYAGNVVDLIALEGGWYAVSYNGVTGYVSADYVREYTAATASSIGEDVVALALSYLGTPYKYGGASAKGFDCSGFTMYIFSQFGYSLPHSATSQWYDSGEQVAREDLQPGDLVLFCDPSRSNGKACSHVGIYIGDGEFVHAASGSSSGRQVRISSLSEDYYNGYYKGAKRLA